MADGNGDRVPDPAVSDVREAYDAIATHFASTREYPWPEVESFLDGRSGEWGLDVGCGNGRHAEGIAARTDSVVGIDVSRRLLDVADDRLESIAGVHLLQADAGSLPVGDGQIDVGVYVATLHHLPNQSARRRSLDELARVLGPGGRGLVSAWSTVHERFDDTDADAEDGFDTTLDWTLPDGEVVPRYYHIYAPAEFESDLRASALVIEDSYVSSGNCYAEVSGG